MYLNKTYKVWVSKHLSDRFPIQTHLKEKTFSAILLQALLYNMPLEVQAHQQALEVNRLPCLLLYAAVVNEQNAAALPPPPQKHTQRLLHGHETWPLMLRETQAENV
jgi:hypothetical protein